MLPSDKMYLLFHKMPLCRCFPLTKCIFASTRSLCADTFLRQNVSSLLQKASVQMLLSGKMHLLFHKMPRCRYFHSTKCIFAAPKSLGAGASLRKNASSLPQEVSVQMLPSDKMHLLFHKKPLCRYFPLEKCICATSRSLCADTFLRQNAGLYIFLMLFLWLEDVFPKNPVNSQLLYLNRMEFDLN